MRRSARVWPEIAMIVPSKHLTGEPGSSPNHVALDNFLLMCMMTTIRRFPLCRRRDCRCRHRLVEGRIGPFKECRCLQACA